MTASRLRPLADLADDGMTPVDGTARGLSVGQVVDALREGKSLSDRSFDRFLPLELRLVSGQHWTPLVVAQQVAGWLDGLGVTSVVDIGSGAGKFCVAAALSGSCDFTGIEQRPRLVQAARGLAQTFGVDARVRFVQGTLSDGAVPDADAYYLYNPFGENLHPDRRLDDDVELSNERYERDVALIEGFLERARVGTYVIKYNGFGGEMPAMYDRIRISHQMPNMLRLWQKTRTGQADRKHQGFLGRS